MAKIIAERCPKDHACPLIEKCPAKALSQEGFSAPVVDDESCIDCKKCISCCPMNALVEEREYLIESPNIFGGRSSRQGVPSGILRRYDYFSTLSDAALMDISQKFYTVQLPQKSKIIKEGQDGDSFFILLQGEVEVTQKTNWEQPAKLSVSGEGDFFGETALLTCSPRSASVTAVTDVELLALKKEDFEETILLDSTFSAMLDRKIHSHSQFNNFKTLQPFTALDPAKSFVLMEQMHEKLFRSGENIICEGEIGETYYIVKWGKVSVSQGGKVVTTLRTGQGFGEEALINNSVRNATVSAKEDTAVLSISKEEFDSVLSASYLEHILADDILTGTYDDFVFLDVRQKAEYEQEHIEGAINYPIETLRDFYDFLNKEKKYIVYCGPSETRSRPATFFLNSQGFTAKNLQGGIDSWMGSIIIKDEGIHKPQKKPCVVREYDFQNGFLQGDDPVTDNFF